MADAFSGAVVMKPVRQDLKDAQGLYRRIHVLRKAWAGYKINKAIGLSYGPGVRQQIRTQAGLPDGSARDTKREPRSAAPLRDRPAYAWWERSLMKDRGRNMEIDGQHSLPVS